MVLLVYCLLLLVYFQFVLDREGAIQRFRRDNARAIYETGSRLLLFSNEIIAICAGTGDKEANGGESSVNPGGEEQPDGSVGVCLQVSFTAGHPGDLKPHLKPGSPWVLLLAQQAPLLSIQSTWYGTLTPVFILINTLRNSISPILQLFFAPKASAEGACI